MIEALNNLWIAFENENLDPVIVKKLIIDDWNLTKKLAQRVNLLFKIVCGWEAYSQTSLTSTKKFISFVSVTPSYSKLQLS